MSEPKTTYDVYGELRRLAELRSQVDARRLQYTEDRTAAIPPEVRERVAKIDFEFDAAVANLAAEIAVLEDTIKSDVKAIGQTVKGSSLMAVFTKGRVTWDGALLEGFSIAHPEILVARKEGEPSVAIRGVK